ncbi:uncharacterized protein LOC124776045 [Schistocerca piceifrons]|uniref:uncharacterized protein LOC124776045 n=1 Tax=Schistocerca piceifrons TaxID=274613 RepID=UPI001F5EC33C|nr:uncharacterized protein LOC124776045 [Schistocerca piceifrons]
MRIKHTSSRTSGVPSPSQKRKISFLFVPDCLHLQLYRDSKDRYKQGHTKASLSLQHFLAIDTGFTLDKESNTIAIICQDVTVILAFDTRERLMQWQVKIVNNLGEDQPFLIQITSAPPRAKISPGPARLHVQEQRFCLTSGVPPRLLGFWDISQLRRYGVVEGRFVFEGGSRCGKGEGVHVCVTDQAEEITKVFQMAAQGKITNRRRAVTRNMSVIDSPRRQVHSRASDVDSLQQSFIHNQTMSSDFSGDDFPCPCSRLHRDSSSPFWLSTETSATGLHSGADLDINFGCGDAMSISDYHQQHQQHHMLHHHHQHSHQLGEVWPSSMVSSSPVGRGAPSSSAATMERCSSCISKLGAASMSRSSTSTTSYPVGGVPFNPAWTMDVVGADGAAAAASSSPCHRHCACARSTASSGCDCMSLSSHGSSGGGGGGGAPSEYCVPRSWYDRPQSPHLAHQPASLPPLVPPKSPKTPPMAHGFQQAQPTTNAGLPPSVAHPAHPPTARVPPFEACRCQCCPPSRPPKPPQLSPTPTPPPHSPVTDSPSKKKIKKPPMPLPLVTEQPTASSPACACPHHPKVALLKQQHRSEAAGQPVPYENYDVPKSLLGSVQTQEPKEDTRQSDTLNRSSLSTSTTEEYYDTPKSIKDSLASTTEMEITTNQYGNYDVPPSVKTLRKPCGCVIKLSKKSVLVTSLVETTKLVMEHEDPSESAPANCPCQKVMCWAENLMMLPYCRRGNGIENTGVPIQKVKLSGEGKMPVVNTSGEIAIYATVDKSKKSRKHLPSCSQGACTCPRVTAEDAEQNSSQSNYVNVDIEGESSKCSTAGEQQTAGDEFCQMDTNYENIDFAQSLEYYENAKDVLMRAGMNQDASDSGISGATCSQKCEEPSSGEFTTHYGTHEIMVCSKCGHECHAFLSGPMSAGSDGDCRISALTESAEAASANAQDDYLMMEPAKNGSAGPSTGSAGRNHPGYLPMSPVPSGSTAAKNDLLKRAHQRGMCNLSSEKSASIPSLASPITQSADKCCKRSELEYHRVPGAAMMMSPYLKQRLAESDERAHQVVCRKRSSSADSRNPEALEDVNSVIQSKMSPAPVRRVCANAMFHKCDPKTEMISTTETEVSSACDVHKETPQPDGVSSRQKEEAVAASQPGSSDESVPSSRRPSINNCELSISEQPKGSHTAVPASVHIRRSSSVPCKSGNNRDSSSSNDSGVSTGSLKQGGGDFSEFELPLTTSVSAKKHQYSLARHPGYVTNCLHSSLPRRSKSVDPLRDITFQFQKIKVPAKSSSAEAEVPVCPKARGFQSPGGESAVVAPYMDSRSTSSGTSDMSDYIETLSVSSHSSSDVQDALLLGRQATTTLRPRSGKEYQLIDRSILDGDMKQGDKAGHPLRTIGGQYANITPVPEKSESPSPGYMSGSPGQERDDQPLILHNFATK